MASFFTPSTPPPTFWPHVMFNNNTLSFISTSVLIGGGSVSTAPIGAIVEQAHELAPHCEHSELSNTATTAINDDQQNFDGPIDQQQYLAHCDLALNEVHSNSNNNRRNARERSRLQAVNQAFVVLKRMLPSLAKNTKRISKLKILRAAITYIEQLLQMLGHEVPLSTVGFCTKKKRLTKRKRTKR